MVYAADKGNTARELSVTRYLVAWPEKFTGTTLTCGLRELKFWSLAWSNTFSLVSLPLYLFARREARAEIGNDNTDGNATGYFH